MLRSVIGFDKLLGSSFKDRALERFLKLIERSTGLELVADAEKRLFSDDTLRDLAPLVTSMKKAGILLDLYPAVGTFPDEPPLFSWMASYVKSEFASGSSISSNHQALIATLAECLERRLWLTEIDYFRDPIIATENELQHSHVLLAHFAGFSDEQRAKHPGMRITPASTFMWIKAHSLTSKTDVYVPAQAVTGCNPRTWGLGEPMLRPTITTGLATGQTRDDALLGGVLEVIERDAFIIMWLNQLSLPRVDLVGLAAHDAELARLLNQIARYRLSVDLISLITDAPAHAVCAVVRDKSGVGPACILGLGCEGNLARAAVHAIAEALRIRTSARRHMDNGVDTEKIVPSEIRHHEHMLYWLPPDRHPRLNFLTSGPVQKYIPAEWEHDTPREHLTRIVHWCKEREYEFVSADLGGSKKNPTPLSVEMVVIPQLQPMHLVERNQSIGGTRITEVPTLFGYAPRETPFVAEPHPFV